MNAVILALAIRSAEGSQIGGIGASIPAAVACHAATNPRHSSKSRRVDESKSGPANTDMSWADGGLRRGAESGLRTSSQVRCYSTEPVARRPDVRRGDLRFFDS